MAVDPLNPQEQLETSVLSEPGFFDGTLLPAGHPTPTAPPDGQIIEPEPAPVEQQVVGMGRVIQTLMKTNRILKDTPDFKRPGPPELGDDLFPPIEPLKTPDIPDPEAHRQPLSETVPNAETGAIEREGIKSPTLGDVPKGVKVRPAGPKVEGVTELYTRYTTDTPFSALDDFNADKLGLNGIENEQDVLAVIAAHSKTYADDITDATGGKIAHDVTRHMAELVGASQGRLVKTILDGELLHGKAPGEVAATMLAARDLLVWSAQKFDGLAKLVAYGDVDALKEAGFSSAEEAVVAMQRQKILHAGIQAKIKGATTELARALSAQNIPAAGAALRNTAIDSLVLSGGDINFARRQAAYYLALEDPVQRGIFIRKSIGVKTLDALFEVWINALLSNPITHVVNFISNAAHLFGQIPVRGVAAAYGRRRRAKHGGAAGVQSGEGTAMAFAMRMALKDALVLSGKAFKDPSSVISKLEPGKKYRQNAASAEAFGFSGLPGHALDLAGTLFTMGRGATRGLAMGDTLFKVLGQRMEIYARAYRETALEFGDEAANRMDDFADALADRIANPSAETQQSAFDFAAMATFTNDLGSYGRSMQNMTANGFVRWFIPFMKTPTNIIVRAWEFTPFNKFATNYKEAIARGGEHADLAKARIALGTGVMVGTSALALSGHITGGGPSDPLLRANLTRQGWQPYSFKINGKYYSYKRFEPFATVIGISADLTEIGGSVMDSGEYEKIFTMLAMALAKNVTSKTYMEGASKMIEILENPDRYGDKALQAFIRSLSPRILAQVEKQFDPELRHVRNTLDALRQDVPGWSETLPVRVDLWGRPMVNEIGPYGTGMINPVYTRTWKPNPVDAEMDRLKFGIGPLSEVIPGTQTDYMLTPEEYHDYAEKAGQMAFISAKEMVSKSNKTYQGATDEGKKILLTNAIKKGRNEGLLWLMKESKHAEQLTKDHAELKQLRVKELTP